jgi:NO-binding membrane sensor protein with MHYT domain
MPSSATVDLYAFAMAALLAVLTCHLALTFMRESGAAEARRNVCVMLQGAFALGTGLSTTSMVLWLAFGPAAPLALRATPLLGGSACAAHPARSWLRRGCRPARRRLPAAVSVSRSQPPQPVG